MKDSKIEWCDHTFNPWIGCTKVSPGCWKCYAEAQNKRWAGGENWGPGAPRRRTSEANWRQPLKWDQTPWICDHCGTAQKGATSMDEGCANAECDNMHTNGSYHRPRVFCASLADWLDAEVSLSMFADLLELVHSCQNLDWLFLSKRLQNWKDRIASVVNLELTYREANEKNYALIQWLMAWLNGTAPANVWIGTTVEDQKRADERIPLLLSIPARVRFLSCEPLLGPVDLTRIEFGPKPNDTPQSCLTPTFMGRFDAKIHWVICGGESGHGARPMLVEWADDLRRQCAESSVPFFMKQLGSHVGTTNANAHDWPEHVEFQEVAGTPQFAGAKVILSDKKGGNIDDFPEELRIRQFPA